MPNQKFVKVIRYSYICLQVGSYAGVTIGFIANGHCDNVTDPAGGSCNAGWKFLNGSKWNLDMAISIECRGKLIISDKNGIFFNI